MPSSSRFCGLVLAAGATLSASGAGAQTATTGFALERFYGSATGAGWLVMDDLSMPEKLGGSVSLTTGYSHRPLWVGDGADPRAIALVSHQAFATVSAAVTTGHFRFYADLTKPLWLAGDSGRIGTYQLTAPSLDPATAPDVFSDVRFGFDTRFFGAPGDRLRLGAGLQLMVPSGSRDDYVTDGDYRALGRLLLAGDFGAWSYAGQAGAHLRDRDDSPAPGGPLGSEVLFGVAAGRSFGVGAFSRVTFGPEIFGATALKAPFAKASTAIEALATARLESPVSQGAVLRLKVGLGGGLNPWFGAPEWRTVAAVELASASESAAHAAAR